MCKPTPPTCRRQFSKRRRSLQRTTRLASWRRSSPQCPFCTRQSLRRFSWTAANPCPALQPHPCHRSTAAAAHSIAGGRSTRAAATRRAWSCRRVSQTQLRRQVQWGRSGAEAYPKPRWQHRPQAFCTRACPAAPRRSRACRSDPPGGHSADGRRRLRVVISRRLVRLRASGAALAAAAAAAAGGRGRPTAAGLA